MIHYICIEHRARVQDDSRLSSVQTLTTELKTAAGAPVRGLRLLGLPFDRKGWHRELTRGAHSAEGVSVRGTLRGTH